MTKGLKSSEANEGKKSRLSKAFDIALTAIIIIIAGIIAYVMIASRGGKAVSFFGKSILVVVTGSMEPSIHKGDFIVVEKTDASALEVNDIITFVSNDEDIKGKLVTHRIIAINDDGSFETKGDANEAADTHSAYPDDIIGRYSGRARFFELVSSFGSPKKLLMLFGIIPLTLIALYEARSLTKLFIEAKVEEKMSDEELKQKLIREEIEKEKMRLREQENKTNEEVKPGGTGSDNEA